MTEVADVYKKMFFILPFLLVAMLYWSEVKGINEYFAYAFALVYYSIFLISRNFFWKRRIEVYEKMAARVESFNIQYVQDFSSVPGLCNKLSADFLERNHKTLSDFTILVSRMAQQSIKKGEEIHANLIDFKSRISKMKQVFPYKNSVIFVVLSFLGTYLIKKFFCPDLSIWTFSIIYFALFTILVALDFLKEFFNRFLKTVIMIQIFRFAVPLAKMCLYFALGQAQGRRGGPRA